MDESIILRKIPLDMYDELNYVENKEMYHEEFDRYLNEGCTVTQAVNGTYYYAFEPLMAENGMDKFVAMISGVLYMIEHNAFDKAIVNVMMGDIGDFETGEFDELFTKTDLELIKKDIATIKEYVAKHPELIAE